MTINTSESGYLDSQHGRLSGQLAEVQRELLAAEDALSVLEDREARRALRSRARATDLQRMAMRGTG